MLFCNFWFANKGLLESLVCKIYQQDYEGVAGDCYLCDEELEALLDLDRGGRVKFCKLIWTHLDVEQRTYWMSECFEHEMQMQENDGLSLEYFERFIFGKIGPNLYTTWLILGAYFCNQGFYEFD